MTIASATRVVQALTGNSWVSSNSISVTSRRHITESYCCENKLGIGLLPPPPNPNQLIPKTAHTGSKTVNVNTGTRAPCSMRNGSRGLWGVPLLHLQAIRPTTRGQVKAKGTEMVPTVAGRARAEAKLEAKRGVILLSLPMAPTVTTVMLNRERDKANTNAKCSK